MVTTHVDYMFCIKDYCHHDVTVVVLWWCIHEGEVAIIGRYGYHCVTTTPATIVLTILTPPPCWMTVLGQQCRTVCHYWMDTNICRDSRMIMMWEKTASFYLCLPPWPLCQKTMLDEHPTHVDVWILTQGSHHALCPSKQNGYNTFLFSSCLISWTLVSKCICIVS